MLRWCLILFFFSTLFSQDFSVYQALIDQGQLSEVQKSLPYLESQYPNHPFVLFVRASAEIDGAAAVEQFKKIIEQNPDSKYAEMSSVKVAEYLYSIGLYTQTSEHLKEFPELYPQSDQIEQVFHLLKKSFRAIGEEDSIQYYYDKFVRQYPNSNFSEYNQYQDIIAVGDRTETAKAQAESVKEPDKIEEVTKFGDKPWVVQVGAFSEKKNADVIVNRLKAAGYAVEVVERTDRVNLYLVQVVRFESIEQAINVGEKLQDQLGLDFRIIERN